MDFFRTDVPINVAVRYRHPNCSEGKDKALIVTRTREGWLWCCHRCGKAGFRGADSLSPHQTIQWLKSLKVQPYQRSKKIELPKDFSSVIPPEGLGWLFKSGLTESDITNNKIGYSRSLHRVIIPVYIDGTLVYWQGRALSPGQDPKYMSVYAARDSVYFRLQAGTYSVVLVEDVLSCIRVAKVTDAIALLYAYIPDALVFELAKEYEQQWFWLDPNKQKHMLNRVKRYRSFGIDVKMVVGSHKDPKYYTDEEIEEKLR